MNFYELKVFFNKKKFLNRFLTFHLEKILSLNMTTYS